MAPPPSDRLAWRDLVFGRRDWRAADVILPTVTAADLWTTPFPPAHGIAPAALETIVQAAGSGAGDRLRIARITARPGAQQIPELRRASGGWIGLRAGREVLTVEGVTTG